MARRFRRLAVAVVLVIVVGSLVLVLTGRPALDHDRRTADRRWSSLLGPLRVRYQGLDAWTGALAGAGAGNRSVVKQLRPELARWNAVAARHDTVAQVRIANTLEGLAARTAVTVSASARLASNAAVAQGGAAFAAAAPKPTLVSAYNDAARRYQRTRQGAVRRFLVGPLGYDALPTLQVPGS